VRNQAKMKFRIGSFCSMHLMFLLFFILAAAPREAYADSIHGLLEYVYNNSNTDTTDSSGISSKIKNDGLLQRYNLAFDRTIYPSLVLSGGGLYEYVFQNGKTDDLKSDSTASRLSPYVDLVLKNPFISSGLGYRRREDTSTNNGEHSPKEIEDQYLSTFGWHPSELPSLDVFYTRRYFYDENRATKDIQTDNYTWTLNYTSIKGLELNYNGNYNLVKDKLKDSETESLNNSGRAAYSGKAYQDRVLYNSSYNVSMQDTTITNSGSLLIFPLNQLFATTPDNTALPPTTVTNGELKVYGGTLPTVNLVAANPTNIQNNTGLSFDSAKEMDTIFLSIVSKIDPLNPGSNTRVPPTVSDLNTLLNSFNYKTTFFSFTVYTSSDGNIWGPATGISTTVTVGQNPTSPGSNEVGFIISFAPQTTRFIKVVQTPGNLNPVTIANPPVTIDPRNILVATIQTSRNIITTPGKSVSSSTISGLYDMNVRALLLDDPNLTYNMNFAFTHSKSDGSPFTTTYLVNNGLGLAKSLSEKWSLTGRITDEVNIDAEGEPRNTVTYNAGLAYIPLPTLNHNLVFGGKFELFKGKTKITNSIYLNNSAELYKGLSMNLGLGYSKARSETGQNSDSVDFIFGAEIVPNRNLTLSLSYQDNEGRQSGGGQPSTTSYDRTATASATFRPLEAIYLTGGYSVFMKNDTDTVTLQNYSVSWSPFRDGDLQFNFSFLQAYDSGQDQKSTNISPSIRWNIRPGSTLDVSYSIFDSKSGQTGDTYVRAMGTQLRIAF
jgi:hypothetical protein